MFDVDGFLGVVYVCCWGDRGRIVLYEWHCGLFF
jgi:hypothetical protein